MTETHQVLVVRYNEAMFLTMTRKWILRERKQNAKKAARKARRKSA